MLYPDSLMTTEYVLFYKKAHPLSNFHPSPFETQGHFFATAEAYIMWRKAMTFGDLVSAEQILQAATPPKCKELGQQIQGFTEDTWAAVRPEVALSAVLLKFGHNPHLREFLLSTGERILVEASPTDRIWGIGYSAQDALAHRHDWGENLLGQTLMTVREQLKQATQQPDEMIVHTSPPA